MGEPIRIETGIKTKIRIDLETEIAYATTHAMELPIRIRRGLDFIFKSAFKIGS